MPIINNFQENLTDIEINNDEVYLNQNDESEKLIKKNDFKIVVVITIFLVILIGIFIFREVKLGFIPFAFNNIQFGEFARKMSANSSIERKSFPLYTPKSVINNTTISPTPENILKTIPKSTTNFISITTPKPILIPSPTPRIPNPPIMSISYPIEMQAISMNQSQIFCIVDVLVGGNTQGLQSKHQLNDGGWSSYTNYFTLCIDPKEGLNSLQMQYKNGDGDETSIYTRQFNFHRIAEIAISLNGQLYGDVNCNGNKDNGENGIGSSAVINIMKLPEFYIYNTINSDNNGNFTYSGKIYENETLTLQPMPVSPSGYKSNRYYLEPSVTFGLNNRSYTVDIPQVPNENVGACQ